MSKRLPPLNWLKTFDAAARHMNFTAAAAELNMTQSAVSQQIRLLEDHLGQRLFNREHRKLSLTNAGLATLTHTPSPMKFLNRILERPDHERPYLLLVCGFPAEDAKVPNIARLELEQIATWV